jgi:hypothetical protein
VLTLCCTDSDRGWKAVDKRHLDLGGLNR